MDVLNPITQAKNFYKDVVEPIVPAGIEAGLMMAPLGRLGLVKGGALAGGIQGATTPEDLSLGERARKTAQGP